MTKNPRRLIALVALLIASLANAQEGKLPALPDVKPNALVSDEDQKLLQEEAQAFTGKPCADAGLSSATMPKPPNVSFTQAVEMANTAYQQGAKVIKQDVTDDSARMYVSMSGLEYFSLWSLVGGDEIKMLGCVVQ